MPVIPLLQSRARFVVRPPATALAMLLALGAVTTSASAGQVTITDSGTSVEGYPLSVRTVLSGTGTTLTVDLFNEGPASSKINNILSSFYFDLVDPMSGQRPQLVYASGSGQAFTVTTSGTDHPVSWSPQTLTPNSSAPSNLMAVNNGDQGWQFKSFSPPATVPDTLAFGIGTVGNSSLKPPAIPKDITFNGAVVSGTDQGATMINLGIYSLGSGSTGIVATDGIIDNFLIRNTARFTFQLTGTSVASLDAFDGSWVGGRVAFGFGTNPDTLLLPEPQAGMLIAAAVAAGIGCVMRRPGRHAAD